METIELQDYGFSTKLGGGSDSWCLGGRVYGHPNYRDGSHIFVSTPKAFDRENLLLKTVSGREYFLASSLGNEEDIFGEIERTIERGGYQSW